MAAFADHLVWAAAGVELAALPCAGAVLMEQRGALRPVLTLQAVAFVFLVVGAALIAWSAGSSSLSEIQELAAQVARGAGQSPPKIDVGDLGCALLLGGLGIHLLAAPFRLGVGEEFTQMHPSTIGMMVVLPRSAALVAAVRLMVNALPRHATTVQTLLTAVSLFSILVGSLLVLLQVHFRRLLAFAATVQAGLILAGLAAAAAPSGHAKILSAAEADRIGGTAAACICFVWDSVAFVGILALLASLEHNREPVERIDELAGRLREDVPALAAFCLLMISIAGGPPLAGFWAHTDLARAVLSISEAAEEGFLPHPNLAYVAAAIAAACGLILVAGVFASWVAQVAFGPSAATQTKPPAGMPPAASAGRAKASRRIGLIAALVTVIFGVIPGPPSKIVRRVVQSSRHAGAPVVGQSPRIRAQR